MSLNRYYDLPGCENRNDDPLFFIPDLYSVNDFHLDYARFKDSLKGLVDNQIPSSILRMGDGEYYFLKNMAIGSASQGKRTTSKELESIDKSDFVEGVLKNNYVLNEIGLSARSRFKELFPNVYSPFCIEYVYALMMNKWILQEFKGKIALIGAGPKIREIQELMKFQQYQDYLGIESFNGYITIPQKFTSDNWQYTFEDIKDQLVNVEADLFLCGMGQVKMAILSRLKEIKPAVYLDVGGTIDALAGHINPYRPYAWDWVNYRLKVNPYAHEIDYMHFQERPGHDIWL